MFRKLTHKVAVNSWLKEANEFTDRFTGLSSEERADYFIYGTRTRAGLQIEGHFILPDGTPYTGPDLVAYPLMISWIEKIIKTFNKQNAHTEAGCISIWRFTLLSFLYPELRPTSDKLWKSIMDTKPLWPDAVKRHYQIDISEGLEPKKLEQTYALVVEILKSVPPAKKE